MMSRKETLSNRLEPHDGASHEMCGGVAESVEIGTVKKNGKW
jgi:hypothetical protein